MTVRALVLALMVVLAVVAGGWIAIVAGLCFTLVVLAFAIEAG